MQLIDMPTADLLRLLTYQAGAAAPGTVKTWALGPCGHMARGGDWCESCLRAEIEHREAGSAGLNC